MKHSLLIGYWFPPAIGAASQRLSGFARGVSACGWRVTVLAAGEPTQESVAVIRAADPLALRPVRFPDYAWPAPPARARSPLRELVFPDRFWLWRRTARRAAIRSIDDSPPCVICATFPPASAAMLGVDLAERWGAPLVLDLRDLWIGPGGYAPGSNSARRRHERLERRAVEAASHVVVVSTQMAEFIARRHDLQPDRITVIPNGYDDDVGAADPAARGALAAPTGMQSDARFVLAHVGTVIERNRPELFFRAVADAPQRLEWLGTGVRIRFVGNLAPAVARRPEFAGLIETTGVVCAAEARLAMQAADALLLLVGDYVGRWGHNAKVFEYLRAGRPILCLEESPGSNDRRLLESLDASRCVFARLSDPADVASGIERVRRLAAEYRPSAAAELHGLSMYARTRLAKRLAEVLNDVAVAGHGQRRATGAG